MPQHTNHSIPLNSPYWIHQLYITVTEIITSTLNISLTPIANIRISKTRSLVVSTKLKPSRNGMDSVYANVYLVSTVFFTPLLCVRANAASCLILTSINRVEQNRWTRLHSVFFVCTMCENTGLNWFVLTDFQHILFALLLPFWHNRVVLVRHNSAQLLILQTTTEQFEQFYNFL